MSCKLQRKKHDPNTEFHLRGWNLLDLTDDTRAWWGTFLQSPHFWYLISRSQKTPFPHIFDVLGPSGCEMDRGKMHTKYFIGRKIVGKRTGGEEP
jgi:hypothetical protein